ncbi:hypothetical protein [Pseudanabaena sp. lw0831]|uniref:hypothetical protein n=1 Tax=Pseudanabaena sp. lw0831 TaxID=1357935 RepID=UPI0019168AD1|nr:hypothetical protein [Pseudanabaena sp. lw0831]
MNQIDHVCINAIFGAQNFRHSSLTKLKHHAIAMIKISNSHYETDFGISSAKGAGNTKIGFLKARRRRAFKKPIFIMRIAGLKF